MDLFKTCQVHRKFTISMGCTLSGVEAWPPTPHGCAFLGEKLLEKATQIGIVGAILKPQGLANGEAVKRWRPNRGLAGTETLLSLLLVESYG